MGSEFPDSRVVFDLPESARSLLSSLPWFIPLEHWQDYGVKLISVKSGLSRHVVRFLQMSGRRFAIKETTVKAATHELGSYTRLALQEVPTLIPVGIVVRDEGLEVVATHIGQQVQRREVGYVVTELMDNVVPDSFLFRRAFSETSRKRIWDAVTRLFVQMHSRGIYWGDASLANMLIQFQKEMVPELGHKTILTAILADAETVEIHPYLSERLRLADVDFFIESMLWTDADMRAGGVVRDPVITHEDQAYVLRTYNERYELELETQAFELVTHIDVDKVLGSFEEKGYGPLILKHVNEHKWYISEQQNREVPLIEAAEGWYKQVFKPVCKTFLDHGLLTFFPEKTAASLYVEVMEHKYYLSQKERKDVGLSAALEDYCAKFGVHEPMRTTLSSIVDSLRLFLSGKLESSVNFHSLKNR
jgi:Domain of unknown function (DUF4032)/Lipopolysaccharide kinase (Kdo/WaaP) family